MEQVGEVDTFWTRKKTEKPLECSKTVGLKLLVDTTIHQQTITDQGLQQLKTIRYQQQSDGAITTSD